MKITRTDIVDMIISERDKQAANPNTLSDTHKTKNDWTSLVGYYLFESASRTDKHVTFEEFRESLIKAGAVIIAALETSFALDDDQLAELLHKLENREDDN